MSKKRARTIKENSTSSSKPPPPTLTITFCNPDHKARFETIKDRQFVVTKFPHLETLKEFRLEQGVRALLAKGGLEGMLKKSAKTWREPTIEFLASMETCEYEGEEAIRFQLQGKIHIMKYSQIAKAFGWKLNEANWDPPCDKDIDEFWRDMSCYDYNKDGGNKVNMVVHPCYRYVLRLLNMTLFLNGDGGSVSRDEIRHFWPLSYEGVGAPNWVDVFVRNCRDEQKNKGKIGFGGMITLLAKELKVKIPTTALQVQPKTSIFYDSFTLKKIAFAIQKPFPQLDWHYLIHGAERLSFPKTRTKRFHIPSSVSTLDLTMQFIDGSSVRQLVEEESMEDNDDDVIEHLEQLDERLNRVEREVKVVRDDVKTIRMDIRALQETLNANHLVLQQQLQRLFSSQEPQRNDPNPELGSSSH